MKPFIKPGLYKVAAGRFFSFTSEIRTKLHTFGDYNELRRFDPGEMVCLLESFPSLHPAKEWDVRVICEDGSIIWLMLDRRWIEEVR